MKVLVISIGVLLSSCAFAQSLKRNSCYFEFGGNNKYYSINYERMLPYKFLARVGAGAAGKYWGFPILVGKYIGHYHHFLEVDAGFTYAHDEHERDRYGYWVYRNTFLATGFIGYRYQPKARYSDADRFLFRLGYTPFFDNGVQHFLGVSFGFRFT